MDTLSNILNSLYTSFVLRDFLAKFIPGSLVLGTALYFPDRLLPRLLGVAAGVPWVWLVILGVCLIAGFAVQALGELTGIIRIYPDSTSSDDARREAIKRMVEVHRLPKPSASQDRERYVIIKEMSANFALAVSIAALYAVFSSLLPSAAIWFRLALIAAAVIFLYLFHFRALKAQHVFEDEVVAAERRTPSRRPRPKKGA